jgi:hypothetical protein
MKVTTKVKANIQQKENGGQIINLDPIESDVNDKILKNYTVMSREFIQIWSCLGKNELKILDQLLNYQKYDFHTNVTIINYTTFKHHIKLPESRLSESISYCLDINLFKIIKRSKTDDTVTIMLNPSLLQKMFKGRIEHQQAYDSLPTYKSLREVK